MKKTLREIPRFKSKAEECDFWSQADTADYLDWSKAQRAGFPNLKPSTETILDSEEKAPVNSIERGEWKRIPNFATEKQRFQKIAKATTIKEYDRQDTTKYINKNKPYKLADLGFSLPAKGRKSF